MQVERNAVNKISDIAKNYVYIESFVWQLLSDYMLTHC